ncbi:MAG: hypothetical protein ACXWDM_10880 [Nocardioides sp.]
MTEQQIRDGYEQLDSALAPPPDAQDRVATRVRARRRHRRATLAGVAALGVVAAGGAAVLMSGGDEPTDHIVATEPPAGSTLTLTRPDGSTYTFPDVTVSCEPRMEQGTDPGLTSPGRIWLSSPMVMEGEAVTRGEAEEGAEPELQQPFIYFEGILAKLQGDRTFTLPVDGPGDTDSYPLILFVADTEGSETGNEVSSAAGGSGTVRVLRAECEPTPVLELEVDGTLGSEEGLDSLDVAGTVR